MPSVNVVPPERHIRLRDSLLLRVLLPMAVVMLVSGGVGYLQARSFLNASYDRSLLEEARSLANQVSVAGGDVLLDMPTAAEGILRGDSLDHVYYQVRIIDGRVVAGDTVLPDPPEDVDKVVYYDAHVQGKPVRVVVVPLVQGVDGKAIVVQYAETRNKRTAIAGEMALALIAPQLALILLAWWAIRRGVLVGLYPLAQLTTVIEQRPPDDPSILPTQDVPQEVLPLISAFNALLLRLNEGANSQKRFIADAAHQLRTPLAALRIQLERALRETDPQVREQLLQQLLGAVERTARLSTQLLMLARAEPGVRTQTVELIDMCALAFETGSRWVPRALEKGADLGLVTPAQALWVRAEAVMLAELVNNLIDNALRYGGRHITLQVGQMEQGIELAVEDDGPGLPVGEEGRVFERFYRAPGSGGNGSGLGLAIVREIASGVGAEVGYRRSESGGACFYVRFPPA